MHSPTLTYQHSPVRSPMIDSSTYLSSLETNKSIFDGITPSICISSSSDLLSSSGVETPLNSNKRLYSDVLKSDYMRKLKNEPIFRGSPLATSFHPYVADCLLNKEVFSFDQVDVDNQVDKYYEEFNNHTMIVDPSQRLELANPIHEYGSIMRNGPYENKKPRHLFKVRFAEVRDLDDISSEYTISDDEDKGCNFILDYFQCISERKI